MRITTDYMIGNTAIQIVNTGRKIKIVDVEKQRTKKRFLKWFCITAATDAVRYSMYADGIETTSYMTYCTLSRKESRKLIEAYQKDLAENPCGNMDADSFGTLNIEWRKDLAGQYLADEYPLTEDFTRTKKALMEILAEEEASE